MDNLSATERLEALGRILPPRARVAIVPHDYPDPDALASAGGLHLMLERRFGVHSRIVYSGAVERAENREMVRHFRYRLWDLAALRPARRRVPAVVVDVRPGTGKVTLPDWMRPIAVVDHHPDPGGGRRGPALEWSDVRPSAGACTSIVYDLMAAAGLTPPTWLAACMVYAIETETMDFTRGGSALDRAAYLALLPQASLRLLGLIKHAPLPAAYFSLLQQAIANARLYGRVAWSHLPEVPHADIVPEIADRLARLERVSHAFCTAFHRDQLLVSIRSNRRNAACGALIRAAVGLRGSAGGHDRLAAAAIPVPGLDAPARQELLESVRSALLRRMERRTRGIKRAPDMRSRPLAAGAAGLTAESASRSEPPAGRAQETPSP